MHEALFEEVEHEELAGLGFTSQHGSSAFSGNLA